MYFDFDSPKFPLTFHSFKGERTNIITSLHEISQNILHTDQENHENYKEITLSRFPFKREEDRKSATSQTEIPVSAISPSISRYPRIRNTVDHSASVQSFRDCPTLYNTVGNEEIWQRRHAFSSSPDYNKEWKLVSLPILKIERKKKSNEQYQDNTQPHTQHSFQNL